jgi:hypothetical protein
MSGVGSLPVSFLYYMLESFPGSHNFPMVNKFEHGDLLAPRRQERQVTDQGLGEFRGF